jgi:anti-sigma-K factor RskA
MSDPSISQPSPEHLEALMSGYVLDALTPQEATEFEQYLSNDLTLIQRLNRMQEIAGLLATPAQTLSLEELRAKIQQLSQAIAPPAVSAKQRASSLPRRPIGQRPSRRMGKLLGAIGALALLILGLDNLRLRNQLVAARTQVTTLQASEAAHEEENYTFELKAQQVGSRAEAIVVFDADTGVLFMGAQNLPPLPANEAYHLWAFTKDNQKILCGRFNTDRSNQLTQQFFVRPEDYKEDVAFMRISREPVSASNQSRRVLVLTSEL